MDRSPTDLAVARLAEGQHGVVSRAQAVACGATDRLLQVRVAAGRWAPVGHHVLRVAGAPVTWHQRLMAAVLDAGPGAVATLGAAAALWHLPGFPGGSCDVLVLRGSNHRPSLGRVTETRVLPDHHVTERASIPVVTTARLVVELAAREHPKRVERAAENAIAADLLTPAGLASTVRELAGKGRRGSTVLRGLVEELSAGSAPPASELEARFRDLVRSAGLPEPVRQLDVGGATWIGRVDVAYPAAGLLIELDSRRWHDSRGAIEADRARSNDLVVAGWRVLRITWRQLVDDPAGVVALVRRLLVAGRRAA